MKKGRRWLALILAVALVCSNALYQLGTKMSASESESEQQTASVEGEMQSQNTSVDTETMENQEDDQKVQVQEISDGVDESPADESKQEVSEDAGQQLDEQPEAEERTVEVKIQQPETDGGQIAVWGIEGNRENITYNSENQYVKTVKEGEDFRFEITTKDSYKVAKVADQNGIEIQPKTENGNVYTYEVTNVTAERIFNITYNKEETTKSTDNDQKKSDDKKTDDSDEEGDSAKVKTQPQNKSKVAKATNTQSQSVQVTVEGVEGRTSTTFAGGEISETTAPELDGYTFIDAYISINGTKYDVNYAFALDSKIYYCKADDGTDTAIELGSEQTIVFRYEQNVTKYSVSYKQIGEKTVKGNSYDGVKLVKEGEALIFKVTTAIGYDAVVKVNGDELGAYDDTENDGMTALYKVENVRQNLSVVIDYKAIQQFNVNLSWKDTPEGKKYLHGASLTTNKNTFSPGETVQWTLMSPIGLSWQLDGWQINKENVKIPTEFGDEENSATTVLSVGKNKGIEVTITYIGRLKQSNGTYVYAHTITIKNAREDIKLTAGNLRNSTWPEVMPIDIVGVTAWGKTNGGWKSLEGSIPIGQNSFGNPMEFRFTVDRGYGNPVVKVDGKELKVTQAADGYYYVNVSKNQTVLRTLDIVAEKIDYSVKYDLDDGTGNIEDDSSYDILKHSTIMISSITPEKKGYYFTGWKLKGTDTVYAPGTTLNINDLDLKSIANSKNELTFIAQWSGEETGGVYVPYKVLYKYQKEDGTYEEETIEKSGLLNNVLVQLKYDESVTRDSVLYRLNKKESVLRARLTIDTQGKAIIVMVYERVYEVAYDGNGADEASVPEDDNQYVKGDSVTVGQTPTREGYIFKGWKYGNKTYQPGKTFKMPAKNVTLKAEWKEKTGKVGYNLVLKSATWNKDVSSYLETNGTTDGGAQKYVEKSRYAKDDTFTVTGDEPVADGYAFVGWFDKDRSKDGGSTATVRNAGDSVNYIYEKSDYTLDALWVRIDVEGTTVPYDGKPHTITNETGLTEGTLADKYIQDAAGKIHYGTVLYSTDEKNWTDVKPEFVDVGDYTVYVKQDVAVGGKTITLKASAVVTIEKRNVTLTSGSDSKPYDEKPLTKDEVSVSEGSFVENEGFTYSVTGSQTEKGDSQNTFEYTLNEGTKADNYNIKTEFGKLTVTASDVEVVVTIKENSGTEKYDGTEKTVTGYSVESISNSLYTVNDFAFKGDATVKATDAGTYQMELKPSDFENKNDTFGNVKFVVVDGTMKIEPRIITLTAASGEKIYDGDPLTNDAVEVTGDGLAEGDRGTYKVTGSQTLVGKSANVIKSVEIKSGKKDVKDNYIIKQEKGTLTVTDKVSDPSLVVKKFHDQDKIYKVGDEIKFTITVKNIYDEAKTITLEEQKGVTLNETVFKNVQPGKEISTTAVYKVTDADVINQTFTNKVKATFSGVDKEYTGIDTVDKFVESKSDLVITKEVVGQKSEYKIGDTVEYKITVKNTGNLTQNNILVEDQMNAAGAARITRVEGAKGDTNGANVTLDTLAPSETATITVEYTVVKEDRGNRITNAAVAQSDGGEKTTPEVPVDVENVYDIHVKHALADGEEGGVALPEDYDIENLKPGTDKILEAEDVEGYVAYPSTQTATIENEDVTVTFVYYKDSIGTDPTNPDQPDNIPDRYQTVVRFEAVNGTVTHDHAVVTLFDENNEPAVNGVGHLSFFQIAGAKANDGYRQSGLTWAPETPTTRYEITGEMTFTARFTAISDNPTTPASVDGTTDGTAGTQGVIRQFIDTISNVPQNAANTVRNIVADVQEIVQSDAGDVPLANQKLDDHKCCILHFLFMLIAAILYGFFIHDMKKRQKKNFELREELDTELAKRGFPTSREQESK